MVVRNGALWNRWANGGPAAYLNFMDNGLTGSLSSDGLGPADLGVTLSAQNALGASTNIYKYGEVTTASQDCSRSAMAALVAAMPSGN
jgi:hypothetical protein